MSGACNMTKRGEAEESDGSCLAVQCVAGEPARSFPRLCSGPPGAAAGKASPTCWAAGGREGEQSCLGAGRAIAMCPKAGLQPQFVVLGPPVPPLDLFWRSSSSMWFQWARIH